MDETTRRWATGCAIGCGGLVAIAAILIGLGYLGVRKMITAVEDSQAAAAAVTERFGATTEFRPPASGEIPAERLEAFLSARELSRSERERLDQTLAALPPGDAAEGSERPPGAGLMSVGAGLALFPRLMAFLDARNEALLASDIGLGEYLYIYSLVYPVWLGTPVDDGPSSVDVRGSGGWEIRSDPGSRQRRVEELREHVNDLLLPMLRSQLEDQRDTGAGPEGWRQALEAEIERMERDEQRLPWQDGLPTQTAGSLEPFRDRLEASYSSLSHPFELVPLDSDRSGG